MKKQFLLTFIFFFQFSFSQVSLSNGKLNKDGLDYKFSEYKQVFQNQEALNYYTKYKTNKTVSMIFGGVGGACMGFGLARALSGGDKTFVDSYGVTHKTKTKGWGLVGVGAGLVGIGIPFSLSAKKNLNKAIDIENGIKTPSAYFKIETSVNSIVLSYNF